MEHRGGGEIGGFQPEQRRDQDEMAVGGDGEELGDSLDEPPHDGLQHGAGRLALALRGLSSEPLGRSATAITSRPRSMAWIEPVATLSNRTSGPGPPTARFHKSQDQSTEAAGICGHRPQPLGPHGPHLDPRRHPGRLQKEGDVTTVGRPPGTCHVVGDPGQLDHAGEQGVGESDLPRRRRGSAARRARRRGSRRLRGSTPVHPLCPDGAARPRHRG